MADKNKNPSTRPTPIEKMLKKFDCPFTWKMNSISKENSIDQYYLNDDEDLFPVLQMMRCIMAIYIFTKAKADSSELINLFDKCNKIMVTIKLNNHPEISSDVVYNVLQATKCFSLKELNITKTMKRVYATIKKDWKMNEIERSTLKACRGICWLKFHNADTSKAEYFIREAIKENPNCDLWYFVLGKCLRRKRKDEANMMKPSKEEINCFKKAYSMSTNSIFGVFLAQLYREMRKKRDAEEIYNKIFDQNPLRTTILLRLAFGYTRIKNFAKAKICLNKVAAACPNHCIFLHYHGIYHFNYLNHKEAADFLEEASKDNDIPAGKQFLDCAVILDKAFDVIQYLRDMVNKENHVPEDQTQSLLDLAFSYWLKKRDIPKVLIVHCITRGESWLFINDDDY